MSFVRNTDDDNVRNSSARLLFPSVEDLINLHHEDTSAADTDMYNIGSTPFEFDRHPTNTTTTTNNNNNNNMHVNSNPVSKSSISWSLFHAVATRDYLVLVKLFANHARLSVLQFLQMKSQWMTSSKQKALLASKFQESGGGSSGGRMWMRVGAEEKMDEFMPLEQDERSPYHRDEYNSPHYRSYMNHWHNSSSPSYDYGSSTTSIDDECYLHLLHELTTFLMEQTQQQQCHHHHLRSNINSSVTPVMDIAVTASSHAQYPRQQQEGNTIENPVNKKPKSTVFTNNDIGSSTSASVSTIRSSVQEAERLLRDTAAILSDTRPPADFVVYSNCSNTMTSSSVTSNQPLFDGSVANATPPPLFGSTIAAAAAVSAGGGSTSRMAASGGAGTILHLACALDVPLCLAFLLIMGADARACHTAFRRLMIHEAACTGSIQCLQLLLELGQFYDDDNCTDNNHNGMNKECKNDQFNPFQSPVMSSGKRQQDQQKCYYDRADEQVQVDEKIYDDESFHDQSDNGEHGDESIVLSSLESSNSFPDRSMDLDLSHENSTNNGTFNNPNTFLQSATSVENLKHYSRSQSPSTLRRLADEFNDRNRVITPSPISRNRYSYPSTPYDGEDKDQEFVNAQYSSSSLPNENNIVRRSYCSYSRSQYAVGSDHVNDNDKSGYYRNNVVSHKNPKLNKKLSFVGILRLFRDLSRQVQAGTITELDAARNVLFHATLPETTRSSMVKSCSFYGGSSWSTRNRATMKKNSSQSHGNRNNFRFSMLRRQVVASHNEYPASAAQSITARNDESNIGSNNTVSASFRNRMGRAATVCGSSSSSSTISQPAASSRSGSTSDGHGNTPLHWAAFKNEVDCVKLLLQFNADPNARAHPSGWTPVHDAAYSNGYESIRLLLDCGAEVDARAHSGATPLCFAAQEDAADAASLLLERGAKLTIRCSSGHQQLNQGQGNRTGEHQHNGSSNMSRFSGYTPLHYCAHYNAKNAARVLLSHPDAKIAMDITDFNDRLPIHVAVARGSSDVLRELLRAGARVEIPRTISSSQPHMTTSNTSRRGANDANNSSTGNTASSLRPSRRPRAIRNDATMENIEFVSVTRSSSSTVSSRRAHPPSPETPSTPVRRRTRRHSSRVAVGTTTTPSNNNNRNEEQPMASPSPVVLSPMLRSMIPTQPVMSSKPWNCLSQRSIDECRTLINEVEQNWTPQRHSLFTPSDRKAVAVLLLAGKRLESDMGIFVDVWPEILSFCGRGWFEKEKSAVPIEGDQQMTEDESMTGEDDEVRREDEESVASSGNLNAILDRTSSNTQSSDSGSNVSFMNIYGDSDDISQHEDLSLPTFS